MDFLVVYVFTMYMLQDLRHLMYSKKIIYQKIDVWVGEKMDRLMHGLMCG